MKNQSQEDFLRFIFHFKLMISTLSVTGTKSSPLQGEAGGVYEK